MTQRIETARRALRATALALAVAAACLMAALPAFAAEPGIYTASTAPAYANPATGVIEDSGGASNQALGESMVTGTTYEKALVEVDSAGNTFVTLRFKLIDQIGDMQFEVSSDGGATFAAAEREQMQTDAANNTGDFRFQIPDENAVVRVHMDVTPMGRAVIFFVQLSDLVAGNSDTFIQTVDPSAAASDSPGAASADDGSATPGDDSGSSAAEEPAPTADGASTTSGVQEFDADGNDVTGGKNAQEGLDGTTIGIVVGVVVLVAVIAGAVVYVVRIRPQRAREAAAAAAAAGAAWEAGLAAEPQGGAGDGAQPKDDGGTHA